MPGSDYGLSADNRMVKKINRSNRDAFASLVQKYSNRMYYYAWQFVKDKQIAEDMVQDVFTDIWIKRKTWKPSESVNGYLLASVKNRCLRYLEKQRPVPESSNPLRGKMKGIEPLSQLVDSESQMRIENSVLLQEIADALQSLPERCGIIFRMHRFEGKSQKEIAEELNISIKTVGNQIQRAVELLYVKLHLHIEK